MTATCAAESPLTDDKFALALRSAGAADGGLVQNCPESPSSVCCE